MRVTVNRLSSDVVRVRKMVSDRIMIRREETIDFNYVLGQLRTITDLYYMSREASDIHDAINGGLLVDVGTGSLTDVSSNVSLLKKIINSRLDGIEQFLKEFQQKVGNEFLRDDAETIKRYVQNIRNIVSSPAFDTSWKSCDTANKIYDNVFPIYDTITHLMEQVSSLVYQYLRDRSPSAIEAMNRYNQLLQRAREEREKLQSANR